MKQQNRDSFQQGNSSWKNPSHASSQARSYEDKLLLSNPVLTEYVRQSRRSFNLLCVLISVHAAVPFFLFSWEITEGAKMIIESSFPVFIIIVCVHLNREVNARLSSILLDSSKKDSIS